MSVIDKNDPQASTNTDCQPLLNRSTEEQLRLTVAILKRLSVPFPTSNTTFDILKLIKDSTRLEAIAIRLLDGEDYPYFCVRGFPEQFIKSENELCVKDNQGELLRDSTGKPLLECMCGFVLRNKPTLDHPFFTEGGSFWTNSTTDLLKTKNLNELNINYRNICNVSGYESVALIPIRSGSQTIGLLQMNDSRRDCYQPEIIEFFEDIASSIGIAFEQYKESKELVESELKYRTLAEHSPDVIIRINDKKQIIYTTPNAEKICIGDNHSYIGKKIGECGLPTDISNLWLKFLTSVFKTGELESFSWHHEEKNRLQHLRFRIVPEYNESGEIRSALCYISDVTEQYLAEQALRESENKFRLVSEQSLLGIIILQDDRFKYVNQAAADIFDSTADKLTSLPVGRYIDMIHPESRDFISKQARKKQSGEIDVAINYEWKALTSEGSTKWVETYSKTVNYQGKPADLITIIDIENRKLQELEQERLIAELQEALNRIDALHGLIPICANCKKIRDDQGYWSQVEAYIEKHSRVEFSHSICPECLPKLYPDYYKKKIHPGQLKNSQKGTKKVGHRLPETDPE